MRKNRLTVVVALVLMVLPLVPALAQGNGRVEGRVTQENGKGIGGVTVVLSELGQVQLTKNDGSYSFEGVPAGTYNLSYSLGENAESQTVAVGAGTTATVDKQVDWDYSFADTITVVSASRRRERIVDAPASVTQISEEQIEREGSHGQLPKLLEFSPGVEATQSGLYDYNFNTRGFNSSLNRRVQVLVDGRDPSVPFLASQEWITVSQYMNDLASAELVRGPSSALYGANAFNGVLNLVTKSPREGGGELRLTGGDLSTEKLDFRWAGPVGGDWHIKLNGSYLNSGDFSRDRVVSTEYAGLPREVRPRVVDENEVTFGNVRLDRYFQGGSFLSIEGGTADASAPAILTGIGRFSLPSVERVWARFNYTADHWNFLTYYNDRQGDEQTSLQSGAVTFLGSTNYKFEFQTNWDWNEGKIRLVAGASHKEEDVDSTNRQGRETLMFAPVTSDSQALFAQLDFQLAPKVKLVVASRYDESTLHDSQFSPKASLVFSINPNNTVRVSYNEAFQVANYSEFFLQADVAPPLNLSPFEGFCAPFGVNCGFGGATRILALGNAALQVEEVESFEIGYTGILGQKAFLTIDYYDSSLQNFITDLLPNVGTPLGRLNPAFGAYRPPAALPAPVAQALLQALQGALGATFFALSNNFDGSPIIGAVSYTNFGQVDTSGIDLGLNYFVTPEWQVNFNYSFFDFDVKQDIPGDPLQANSPENSGSFGVAYVGDRFDASLSARFVEGFQWFAGAFRGPVPSYETVDLTANYKINDSITFGINVSNLFDDEHYEAFGGDLLGRRALGTLVLRF